MAKKKESGDYLLCLSDERHVIIINSYVVGLDEDQNELLNYKQQLLLGERARGDLSFQSVVIVESILTLYNWFIPVSMFEKIVFFWCW